MSDFIVRMLLLFIMLDQNIPSAATCPLFYTQNPSLHLSPRSRASYRNGVECEPVSGVRDAVPIGKRDQLNNPTLSLNLAGLTASGSLHDLTRDSSTSPNLIGYNVCQIVSEDVKRPEEIFALATQT